MKESDLQRAFEIKKHPRDSLMTTNKRFVDLDTGQTGGTQWLAFYVKYKKSYYFDSFGGQPDKVLINQLPKPIIYHNLKIQDINSKLCGSYCLYFFYCIERKNI